MAPFSREALFRQVGPLIGGTLMGLLVLAATHSSGGDAGLIFRAATITAITVTATAVVPWHRLPSSLQAAPPLLYLLVAFLLGQATGGVNSVYEQLVLLPILWLAVYASGFEFTLGLLDGRRHPDPARGGQSGDPGHIPRAILLLTGLATILGFSVQRILHQIRATTSTFGSAGPDGRPDRRGQPQGLGRVPGIRHGAFAG